VKVILFILNCTCYHLYLFKIIESDKIFMNY